jgi:uncharacterized protein
MALPGLSFEVVRAAVPLLGIRADRTALIALLERGPVETPTLVSGGPEFSETFGGPVDGMLGPLAAGSYFDCGGEDLVVARFVPKESSRAAGAIPFVHASTGAGELELRTRDPGAFGNSISVDAAIAVRTRARGVVTATGPTLVEVSGLSEALFDSAADTGLPVRVLGTALDVWTTVANVSALVGTTQTLTLAPPPLGGTLPGAGTSVVLELYEPTFALRVREPGRADVIVVGLDLGMPGDANALLAPVGLEIVSAAPGGAELPVPGVRVRLAGGDDGLALGGDVIALRESFERALLALEQSDVPNIVVAPDLWSRIFLTKGVERLAFEAEDAISLADAMVQSAARTRDRIVLVDPPLGGDDGLRPLTPKELVPWRAEREAELLDARDFAATYTPWVRIVAGPVFRGDDTLIMPPSASVAGRLAKTARLRGPWIATGNVALEQIVSLAETPTSSDEEALQDIGINPLRMTLPRGATIQGVRSLSWPDRKPWRFISTRGLFNFLRRALGPIGLSYAFEPNTPETWISVRRDIERLLNDLYGAGALAGSRPEDAFFVKVDESLNPQSARDAGILTAEIAVAPAFPLEFLVVRLVVSGTVVDVAEEPISP